jgi:hypothetical protein
MSLDFICDDSDYKITCFIQQSMSLMIINCYEKSGKIYDLQKFLFGSG